MKKTYWHLEKQRKIPDDYTLTSEKLLYHPEKSFEINTPFKQWYQQYVLESPLQATDWEEFSDPAKTTYSSYVTRQSKQEEFTQKLLLTMQEPQYLNNLSPAWIQFLQDFFGTLRFPIHGLQMLASYIGQLAPSGKLAIAALFQAADEMRHIQSLVNKIVTVTANIADFKRVSRHTWQTHPAWQPLRKTLETQLICYDFGETLIKTNLVIKPMFDYFCFYQLVPLALEQQDYLFSEYLLSLYRDCQWQLNYSQALVQLLIQLQQKNLISIEQWVKQLYPSMYQTIEQLSAALQPLLPTQKNNSTLLLEELDRFYRGYLTQCSIKIAAK
ncbi:MAG: hypothetical protein KIT27_03025 [Legionellales bacterium]|nr:hypothetical protein [Legionellales bacterium]